MPSKLRDLNWPNLRLIDLIEHKVDHLAEHSPATPPALRSTGCENFASSSCSGVYSADARSKGRDQIIMDNGLPTYQTFLPVRVRIESIHQSLRG